MSEKKYTEAEVWATVLISLTLAVCIVFGFVMLSKYSDMKDQRDTLIQREALREHDAKLMEGQRDFTVHEMLERQKARTQELYPGASQDGKVELIDAPPIISEEDGAAEAAQNSQDDTPTAVREAGENAERGIYGPGPAQ